MKKYVKALANLGIALVGLLLVLFLAPKVLVFFSPFVVGWVIALIASPFVRFFEEKLKIKRKAGSAFVIIAVIALVVFAIYLAGAKLVTESVRLIEELPEMWENAEADFQDIADKFDGVYKKLPVNVQEGITGMNDKIGVYVGDLVGKLSTPTITAVGNFAKQLPTIIINVIMTLLSAYFFVAERNTLGAWFRQNMPGNVLKRYRMLKNSLLKAVGGYFKAQFKIEIWMYLLLVIGLSILHVRYTLLIALLIAILDFFPFFGTGTIMVPWAIVKILSGDYQMALGLLIIWSVGQLARQVIQPKIVGDSIGVPPIPTLFLLYIGYKVSGVLGMIFAVPIGLIVYTMYQEGVFDTTRNSTLLLVSGINEFRKLKPEDMEVIEKARQEDAERKRKLAEENKNA